MAYHNNYLLLKQRLLHHQQLVESMLQHAKGVSENSGKIQMVETRLFVGLNDAETKKQLFDTEQCSS